MIAKTNISLNNVANTIAETADLYTCCTSNKINPYSFYKPINNVSMTELSDSDYYAANDGFFLYTFTKPQQMLYELQHNVGTQGNRIWDYVNRTAPYRLTDFGGYDHYANKILDIQFTTGNIGKPGDTLRLECTGLSEFIQRWAYLSGHRNNANIIFLIYRVGTEYSQSGAQSVYVYKVTSLVDWDADDMLRLKIPSNLSNGDYELRPALFYSATYDMDDGQCVQMSGDNVPLSTWWALPKYSKQTFTVNSTGGGGGTTTDYFNYLGISFYGATYDWNDSTHKLSNISFTNYIVINNSSNLTFDLYATYWYDVNPGDPTHADSVKLMEVRRTLSEEGVPYANIRVTYNDTINIIADPNLDDRIGIRANYTLIVNATSQTKEIKTTINKE
jgi:hypothetical protein